MSRSTYQVRITIEQAIGLNNPPYLHRELIVGNTIHEFETLPEAERAAERLSKGAGLKDVYKVGR